MPYPLLAHHNPYFALAAVAIAMLAAYTVLDVVGSYAAARGYAKIGWLVGGALVGGVGLWSAHFMVVLGWRVALPAQFDVGWILLSLVPAIATAGAALLALGGTARSWVARLLGSLGLGGGIAATHFLGIVSLRLGGTGTYPPQSVPLFATAAIALSFVAWQCVFQLRSPRTGYAPRKKLFGAALMGSAIAAMHYTNLTGVSWQPDPAATFSSSDSLQHRILLAIAAGSSTLLLLGATLLAALFDRQLAAQALQATRFREAQYSRLQLFADIALKIRQSLELDEILLTAVTEVRQLLGADRVAIFRFHPDWSGKFVVESVGEGWCPLVGAIPPIADTYLQETQGGRYRQHENFAVADIYRAGHQPCHVTLLEAFQARAYAIVPIMQRDRLWGLLAAYQNTGPRAWSEDEVALLAQIGIQMGIALEQSQLVCALRESEAKFRQLAENISEVFWMRSIDNRFLYVSPPYETQWHQSADRLYADPTQWVATIHPDDRDRLIETLMQHFTRGYDAEYRALDPNGTVRWIRDRAFPIYGDDGQIYRVVGIAEDITTRKQAEKQLQRSLQEKETLLKEIHHRVKNNLQIVTSLMRLQACKLADPTLLNPFIDSQNRIQMMALIHEQLYQSENLSQVNFGAYLQALVNSLMQTYATHNDLLPPCVTVEDIALDLDRAIPCGLIACELVSNALKYAFPDRKAGEIWLKMHGDGEYYHLIVGDNGIGFPADLDFRQTTSLGMQLVIRLTRQLKGTIDLHRNGGTEFHIAFPRSSDLKR